MISKYYETNKSCLNELKFWEASENHKSSIMLKISALYFMWNPEICQDAPNQGQDDLVLWWNQSYGYIALDETGGYCLSLTDNLI
jgi:hypothetical protein